VKTPPESKIEAYLREQCARRGWAAMKWVSPGNAGVPDRIIIGPACGPVAVEVKTKGGRLAPLQRGMHAYLASLGWKPYVVWTYGDIDNMISELEEK